MISIDIDLGPLDNLRRGWDAGARRALVAAFKGEAFRLKTLSEREIAGGVGPSTAALTRKEQRTPSGAALSAFARFVAYQVEDEPSGPRAAIGLGRSVTRARSPEGRRRQLVALFAGSSHPITREDQGRIAAKVRKRLGRGYATVLRRLGLSARYARGLSRRDPLALMIPPVGSVLEWPQRDWVAALVAREGPRSAAAVAKLYGAALRGERWAREWWA